MKRIALFAVLVALCATGSAFGATITYTTASGQLVEGLPVSATAEVTTSLNSVTVKLTNELSNPTSVSQAISGFLVTFAGGITGTLTSTAGQLINVAANGSFTNVGGNPDWLQAGNLGSTALGASGPDNTIIGLPGAGGIYSNANGSIAGNDPHNPFTQSMATFVFNAPGVTASTQSSSFNFQFGTGPITVPGGDGGGGGNEIPEPATLALIGGGLVCVALRKKFAS